MLAFSIYNLMIRLNCMCTVEHALHEFVSLVPDLSGVQHVSFNVHLLSHLVASVRRWGPLWCSSAANNKLFTHFYGTRGDPNRSFIGSIHLRNPVQLYVTDSSATNVIDCIRFSRCVLHKFLY